VGVVTSTDPAIEQRGQEFVRASGPSGQDAWWPADPPPGRPLGGVQLSRLIVLAGLTPAQALEIGADLVASMVGRPEPDHDGPADVQVMIGTDGRVVLGRALSGGPAAMSPSVFGPTSATVETVLAELADAARSRARRPDRLLAELERAAALVPLVDLPVVAGTLNDACAAIDRDGVRAELAALVRAITHTSEAITVSGAPLPAPTVAAGRQRQVEPRARGHARVARRRIGAWLLSVAVIVTIVLLEFAFLRDDILADVHLLLDAGRAGSVPSVAPEPDPLPLVAPAPPAAGSVLAVDLRALDRCTLGAPCPMRVLIRLVPGAEPQTVTWSIRVVDRCTGGAETVSGGSVMVAPGEEQATAVGPVPLPQTASAVFAVTERPAVAAGAPVVVGSCSPTRPAG
jgi:hypothetical protein